MAAQSGAIIIQGASGRRYYKNIYFDDTATNLVRFDAGAGAGAATPDFLAIKENSYIRDIILAAATGQTKTQICVNDNGTGDILLNALHLVSVTSRPVLGTPLPAGSKLTMIQLA